MPTPNPILNRLQQAEEAAVPLDMQDTATVIAEESAKQQARATVGQEITADLFSQSVAAQEKGKEAIADAGAAKQIVQKQVSVSQMNAENQIERADAAGGGEQYLNDLISARVDTLDEVLQDHADIDAHMDRDITGLGIIDGVLNAYASIGARIRLESDQKRLDSLNTAISNTARATAAAQSRSAATKRTVTDATIAAEQQQIAAESTMLAAKFNMTAAATNAEWVNKVVKANDNQLNAIQKYHQIQNSITASKSSGLREQILQKQYEDLMENDKALDLTVDKVAAGYLKLNKTPPDRAVLRSDMRDKQKRKVHEEALIAGQLGIVAASPADAVTRAKTVGGYSNPYWDTMLGDVKKGKTPTAYNTNAKVKAGRHHKQITPGDITNWYANPGLDSIAQNETFNASDLYQKVLKPQQDAMDTEQRMVEAAAEAANTGVISWEKAAEDIVLMAKTGRSLNNTLKDYAAVGLPNQEDSKTLIKFPAKPSTLLGILFAPTSVQAPLLTESEIVDLTDITQVEQMLIRMRSPRPEAKEAE